VAAVALASDKASPRASALQIKKIFVIINYKIKRNKNNHGFYSN